MTRGLWQLHNKIHADGVPRCAWNRKRVELSNREMPLGFCPEAEVAGRDVLPHKSRHLGPPVVPRHQFQGLPSSGVSGNSGVVAEGNNTSAQVEGIRHISLSAEVKNLLCYRPLC